MKYIFILTLCLLLTGCGNSWESVDTSGKDMPKMIAEAASWPPGAVPLSTKVLQTTPKGAVHSGEYPLSQQQLDIIDNAITALNASAVVDGFNSDVLKPHSFYRVSTPKTPCVLSPLHRLPSFVINAGIYYDGTEYDQYNTKGRLTQPRTRNDGVLLYFEPDGTSVVFAPELVLSSGNSGGENQSHMYVCPDVSVLGTGVEYGAQHIFLFNVPYNDKTRNVPPYDNYNWASCSAYHGTYSHPLLPRMDRCVASDIQKTTEKSKINFIVKPVL